MFAKVEASTWYVSCSTRLSKLCEGATVSKGLRRYYHMYRTTILGVGGGEDTHNKIRGVGVDPYKSILAHSQIALPTATRTIGRYPLGPRGQGAGTSPGAAHTRAWAGVRGG